MTNKELVKKLIGIANNYKTLYVMGCFGAPMTDANKTRYCSNHSYNKNATRQAMIKAATSDTFGFDCVNLIKGVLWGWNGDKSKTYGGAKYATNGVPDINADGMIAKCLNVSTDFSSIEVGEAVWCPGHIGVYIGDGLAVECTPSWKNCVQITACNCAKSGYNRRDWVKHGKLPYITYEKSKSEKLETGDDIIYELMNGKHKVEINEVQKAIDALDKAKNNQEFMSLYWILYKLVNGSDSVASKTVATTEKEIEPYTYHIEGITHIIECDPRNIFAVETQCSTKNVPYYNFVNSIFFMTQANGIMHPQGIVVNAGQILSNNATHGKPVATLIVYGKDNVQLKYIDDITKEKDVWFAVSGYGIYPNITAEQEGFTGKYSDVLRSTDRPIIGYRKKDNKIVIAVRSSSDASRANQTAKNLGLDFAISLDAGGSTALKVNNNYKFKGDGRQIWGGITWS